MGGTNSGFYSSINVRMFDYHLDENYLNGMQKLQYLDYKAVTSIIFVVHFTFCVT